jgi:hypothetical protein
MRALFDRNDSSACGAFGQSVRNLVANNVFDTKSAAFKTLPFRVKMNAYVL